MRDGRLISLKNPRLQDIRDNLRLLWINESKTRWQEIFKEMKKVCRDESGILIPFGKMKQRKVLRYRELQSLEVANRDLMERSICTCYYCGVADRDVVYKKVYSAWICVDCVSKEKKQGKKI